PAHAPSGVTSEMQPLVGKYTWLCSIPPSCRTSDDASSISSQLASIRLRSFAGRRARRRLVAIRAASRCGDVRQQAIEFLLHDPVAFAGLRFEPRPVEHGDLSAA